MKTWFDENLEREEFPDEYLEETPEETEQKKDGVPDVSWAEDIRKIEDPEIREKEIKAAEKILEKEEELNRKFEAGEIDEIDFWAKHEFELSKESRKAATRCGLESVGIGYDDLGDLAEDWDLMLAELGGNPRPAELKHEVRKVIERVGPEEAERLADGMRERKEISKETHDLIARQARMSKK